MATYKFGLDGTFSLDDLNHLMGQVQNIPYEAEDRYDYNERARRRFKGVITISVEETTPAPKPPTTE